MLKQYNASLVEDIIRYHLDGHFMVSQMGETILNVYMTDRYGDNRTLVARFDFQHPEDVIDNINICCAIEERFNRFTVAEFLRYIDKMPRIIDDAANKYLHKKGLALKK